MARKTRRNKRNGGGNNDLMNVVNDKKNGLKKLFPKYDPMNTSNGGKRRGKTRRASKGASDWNKKVMKVYHDMKRKDKSVKLGDAMKRASQMKKRGEL